MAKKQKINKTHAVRDYLEANPDAMSGDIAAALTKQGVTITKSHVANIKSKLKKDTKSPAKKVTAKKATRKTTKKPQVVEVAVPVIIEKPTNGGSITLEQIKKVALMINSFGGYRHVTEILEVIKELGGVKKFKDLAEAMSVPEIDAIPY